MKKIRVQINPPERDSQNHSVKKGAKVVTAAPSNNDWMISFGTTMAPPVAAKVAAAAKKPRKKK